MTNYRHGLLAILSITFSINSFAQFVACPQLNQHPQRPGSFCGLDGRGAVGGDHVFSDCVVRDWAEHLHQTIERTMQIECNTEQQVRQAQAEYAFAIRDSGATGIVPQPLQFPQDVVNIMGRLDPEFAAAPPAGEEAYPVPWRRDDCLANGVMDSIKKEISTRCNPEILTASCNAATDAVNTADETFRVQAARTAQIQSAADNARRDGRDVSEAIAAIDPSAVGQGPLESYRQILETIGTQLNNVKAANMRCSEHLSEIEGKGCLTVYQEYFNDQTRADLVARNCSHRGLSNSVDEYVHYMTSSPLSPAKMLRRLSETHIINREKESGLALQFEGHFNQYVQLEALLSGRAPATAEYGPQ